MGLWLTEDEKQRQLDHLSGRIEAGQVDEEIIPLIDTINAYPDMVTAQSCSGHYGTVDGEVRRNVSCGNLWVRTTEHISGFFCKRAAVLAAREEIYQVSLMWGRSNTYQQQEEPLWEFVFAGLNESPAALATSMDIIAAWVGDAANAPGRLQGGF